MIVTMEQAFTEKIFYETPTRLPDPMIAMMVQQVKELTYNTAETGSEKEGNPDLDLVRRSNVAWINWDEWIPGIIHNIMTSANEEYFHYDLTHFDSRIQSTIYNGEDEDFYTWHTDDGTSTLKPEYPGQERKLSCSLLLSDADEYEGGEFQIHYHRNCFMSLKPRKGSALVFPSWIPHRVRPVKSGQRISLVAWMKGPMFK
tara:strand:+ start:48 stop:650 length:603 start_codon:yes stop_codon:yes gene_type:complete